MADAHRPGGANDGGQARVQDVLATQPQTQHLPPNAGAANTSKGTLPPGPPPTHREAGDIPDQDKTAPVARATMQNMEILSVQELDPETLDPNRHYRWVRRDRVPTRKRQGYELELHRKGGPRPYAEPEIGPDKSIRLGDLVLMSCPKVHREQRERRVLTLNQLRLKSASESTEQLAAQAGTTTTKQDTESVVADPRSLTVENT